MIYIKIYIYIDIFRQPHCHTKHGLKQTQFPPMLLLFMRPPSRQYKHSKVKNPTPTDRHTLGLKTNQQSRLFLILPLFIILSISSTIIPTTSSSLKFCKLFLSARPIEINSKSFVNLIISFLVTSSASFILPFYTIVFFSFCLLLEYCI